MSAILRPGEAAAWSTSSCSGDGQEAIASETTETTHTTASTEASDSKVFEANQAWELDRALLLERSERRAWQVAGAGWALGLIGIAAVFVQGPLRRIVEIPIVVDRVTGEATIQQRLSVETVPPLEALDKHNLATFVRAREGYNWMFLQRDFDQVARMAVPAVFTTYNRQFEGDGALQKKIGATEDWRINIVNVRLATTGRSQSGAGGSNSSGNSSGNSNGNAEEATVTYDKVVHLAERSLPDVTTRHVASLRFRYQPGALAKEGDRLENPFGFVVTAYRSDPEITTETSGARP